MDFQNPDDEEMGYTQCIEAFQNLFSNSDYDDEEKQVCKHEAYVDDSRQHVCRMCGLVIETLDFEQAWCDLSRCYSRQSKPKGIRKVFETNHIDISPMMMDIIEGKYKHIQNMQGKRIFRGKYRKAVVAPCLFYTYQEFGEFRTSNYIKDLFKIKQKEMNYGISMYMKAFPKSRFESITIEKLLPWIMKLTGVDPSHYNHILKLTQLLEKSSKIIKRCNPQLAAATIIFFYLCLKRDYMKQIGITKTIFAKKAKISEITIIKIVKEIVSITQADIKK